MNTNIHLKTPQEAVRIASAHINIMLGPCLDIADSHMRDNIAEMKKAGIFRQQLKRDANLALGAFEQIKKVLYFNTTGKTSLYLDALDIAQDSVKADITELYFAIKQVLDNARLSDTAMKARAILVHVILEIGNDIYEGICKAVLTASGYRPKRHFCLVDPSHMLHHWTNVTESLCRLTPDVMDSLRENPHIITGRNILIKRLTDIDCIEQLCHEALDLYPEIKKQYDID